MIDPFAEGEREPPAHMKPWDRRMIGHFRKWHIMYLPERDRRGRFLG